MRRRLALLLALALAFVGTSASPASARDNPNCRAGTTLAVIAGKTTCLRARARCLTKLDREYKTYGYRCRKGRKRAKRRSRLTLGAAKARRYGDAVALRPSGRIDKATALQAFAQTIGPLPGVKAKRGAVGRMRSGTAAWHWLELHRSKLTTRQRAAFDRYRASLFPAVTASSTDAITAQKYLNEVIERIALKVGEPLGIPARLSFGAAPAGEMDALAVTDTVTEGAGKVCRVTVTPAGQKEEGAAMKSTLAHEAFHCFQEKWNPTGYQKDTFWLWEGSAAWAAHLLDLERGYTDPSNIGWWSAWLQTPGVPIDARSYTAIGFFAHMEASGIGFWANMKPLIQQPNGDAAYATVSGIATTGDRLVDTWGPSYHRANWPGPGWNFTGPAIPPAKASVPKSSVTNGGTVPVTSVARGAAIRRVSLKADVTIVSGDARGRLTDYDSNQRPLTDGTYCTRPGGCTCPDAKPGPPDSLDGALLVGVSGHKDVATVKFKGQSLKDWCKKAPAGGRTEITGAFSGTITEVGSCSVSSDGEFQANFVTNKSPRRILQIDTGSYAGPGPYPATQSGVTSGPRVWVTDGFGTDYGTDHQPEDADAGGFTVSSETARQMRGTVDAAMFDDGQNLRGHASGTWVCDKV